MTPKFKVPNGGDCYDNPPEKKDIVLACGTGSGVALPLISGPVPLGFTPAKVVVGTVTLDTRKLEKPSVKVDFSSVINLLADVGLGGLSLSILFTLSKVCDGDRIPLGSWTYQKTVAFGLLYGAAGEDVASSALSNGCIEVDFRESFGFNWCECQNCPDCCTYVVEVADVQSFNIQSVSITNVSISALAVGC